MTDLLEDLGEDEDALVVEEMEEDSEEEVTLEVQCLEVDMVGILVDLVVVVVDRGVVDVVEEVWVVEADFVTRAVEEVAVEEEILE